MFITAAELSTVSTQQLAVKMKDEAFYGKYFWNALEWNPINNPTGVALFDELRATKDMPRITATDIGAWLKVVKNISIKYGG